MNKTYPYLTVLAFSFTIGLHSCGNSKKSDAPKIDKNSAASLDAEIKKEPLTFLNIEELGTVKMAIENGSDMYSSSYGSLIKEAEDALNEGPFSVTDKTQIPPSGDKRDYMSIGVYWWPDTEKSNGLPWIRKDGVFNPITRGEHLDLDRKGKLFSNTYRLAFAHFLTGEEKYANKAIELLKVWFLNTETKMNPNLNYAQGIPGITDGRGIGIIEFSGIVDILNAIELLELSSSMGNSTSNGLRKWLEEYLDWLQHSDNGVAERDWKNNHGTWYDVQVVSLLLFFDRNDEAEKILETFSKERIRGQIKADGTLPLELERTRTLHYSAYNLEAFTYLAFFGKKVNVDLWNYRPKEAGSIQDAYSFLYPYVIAEKEWIYPEISGVDSGNEYLKKVFLMAGKMFDKPEYVKVGMSMNNLDDFKVLSYSF